MQLKKIQIVLYFVLKKIIQYYEIFSNIHVKFEIDHTKLKRVIDKVYFNLN